MNRHSCFACGSLASAILMTLVGTAVVGCGAGGPDLPPIDLRAPGTVQTATFGLGCFWGAEAQFGLVEGVVRTRVGYSGGTTPDPTYGALGDHTETVQVDFDPSVVSYEELLAVFFSGHDCSVESAKRQYMSVVFYHDSEQERAALKAKAETEAKTNGVVATETLPAGAFYMAEDYHQKYALQGREFVMRELRVIYPDFSDIVDSTAAARLNGYAYGAGNIDQLRRELDGLGLSDQAEKDLLALVDRSSRP